MLMHLQMFKLKLRVNPPAAPRRVHRIKTMAPPLVNRSCMIVVLLLSWIGKVALFAGAVDSHADPAETPGKMPRTSPTLPSLPRTPTKNTPPQPWMSQEKELTPRVPPRANLSPGGTSAITPRGTIHVVKGVRVSKAARWIWVPTLATHNDASDLSRSFRKRDTDYLRLEK